MKNAGAAAVVLGFVLWFGGEFVIVPYNLIGLPVLVAGVILYLVGRRGESGRRAVDPSSVHVDLFVTRSQVDSAKIVPLDVPGVGTIEVKLDPIMDEGMQIRMHGRSPDGGDVYAHIKIH